MINSSNSELTDNNQTSYIFPNFSTNDVLRIQLDSLRQFRIIFAWISLVIVIIGLIGNFVSFFILTSPKMRISTNVFLSSLCVSGFIALFGLLFNSIIYDLSHLYGLFPNFLIILYKLYPYIYPIITTFQMASILLTVCVSVNQFLYIYFSKLRSQSKQSKKQECQRAFKIVILMFLISILYCIPYWLKFGYDDQRGLHETELSMNQWFKKIVHLYMYLPIAYIIPFSILIFTNAYLIATITSKKKRQQKLGIKENRKVKKDSDEDEINELNGDKNDKLRRRGDSILTLSLKNPIKSNGIDVYKFSFVLNNPRKSTIKPKKIKKESSLSKSVTIMLIAVVFLFFICQFPVLILHLINSTICSTNAKQCNESFLLKYYLVISKLLLNINLSCNFVCYCLFSKKFRTVFKEIFSSQNFFKSFFCFYN
ncbi:unnamed protein product [Brachionus calyciflorus]|uniref:G-protein coupled receptors family 1 profile domain-containing protein n=1 Tax=Brachionus calyciflorus TaxID=104777 RepID=A0A813RRJ5_9BILA|nr:unnamed protein product [Brachionus calyciflorus]